MLREGIQSLQLEALLTSCVRPAGVVVLLLLGVATESPCSSAQETLRARDLGVAPGVFQPGPLNAITDVKGVQVGQYSLVRGENVRTGVTAIFPHAGNLFQEKVPAAIHVGNAFGKLVGSTQVEELGQLETPILLTNTLAVWDAAAAVVEYMLALPGNEDVESINPVIAETNDGWLNDIRSRSLEPRHFLRALESAAPGPMAEGSVGAGTGTIAFGFKGGIGTSSRRLPGAAGAHTVGILVQTNFGGLLSMGGVPIGKALSEAASVESRAPEDGSCVIVVATDAPLDARQLKRLASRALAGMARTGASFSNGSGDYVIAFTTARSVRISHRASEAIEPARFLRDDRLSPLFQAVAEATQEAIYNSLLQATTVRGFRGREVRALPIHEVRRILSKHGGRSTSP